MRTIDNRPVRFGELAGPLVHGSAFFDWQLVSTQEIARAIGYPFQEIVAADGIPYAPIVVSTTVHRYPTFDDAITVETVPRHVGDSSMELVYEMVDGDGEPIATARMVHVTIGPDGTALSLPNDVRETVAAEIVDREPTVGPDQDTAIEPIATYDGAFPVRSPHIEGSALAYFEEYPGFADVALEERLEAHGTSLAALCGEKQPFRLRDWRWEFLATSPFESTLDVECDVLAVERDTLRVGHTFSIDGRTCIEGVTEYGCFDRSGRPVDFDEETLAPFESDG